MRIVRGAALMTTSVKTTRLIAVTMNLEKAYIDNRNIGKRDAKLILRP